MPLHVARLRDSDLAAEARPEACWYAVLLWSASWHQLPTASLPDNDAVLTKLIGLGRDVKTFRKHKTEAMRGFVLCADGRLYHPTVAEQAIEGWRRKLEQRWRTECARIKKANQRNETNDPAPTFEDFMAALPEGSRLPVRPHNVPRDNEARPEGQKEMSPETDGSCPSGNSVQGTEIGTGTGTGTLKEDANASLPDRSDPTPTGLFAEVDPIPPRKARRLTPTKAEVAAIWAITPKLGRERSGQADLEAQLAAAMRRGHDPAAVLAGVTGAYASTTYAGDHAKGVHRLVEKDRWLTFAEAPAQMALDAPAWPGPSDLWSAVKTAKGEDWATNYLNPCVWRDMPQRALVSPNGFIVDTLRKEVGPLLASMDVTVIQERAA